MESKSNMQQDVENQICGQKSSSPEECAICLQPCLQPVKLPCNHIFCFLCIKGITLNHQKHLCPMCRSKIAPNFLENPNLIVEDKKSNLKRTSSESEQKYRWFYSGAHGWWEYDERTAGEIDQAFDSYIVENQKLPTKKKRTKKKQDKDTNGSTKNVRL